MMVKALMLLIALYQRAVSPMMPSRCRFHPSCSAYAADAIRLHGPTRGIWLSFRRLIRCHPFNPGGYDPVPAPVTHSSPEAEGA